MPLGNGFFGVNVEELVARVLVHFDPWRLEFQHQVRGLGRLRQGRVDGRGKGVDELGPFGAEQPQGAAAMLAEMPLGRAGMGARLAGRSEERRVGKEWVGTLRTW